MSRFLHRSVVAAFAAVLAIAAQTDAAFAASPLPAPAVDIPAASVQGPQTAVFAGGCMLAAAEAVCAEVRSEKSEARMAQPAEDFSLLTSHFALLDGSA